MEASGQSAVAVARHDVLFPGDAQPVPLGLQVRVGAVGVVRIGLAVVHADRRLVGGIGHRGHRIEGRRESEDGAVGRARVGEQIGVGPSGRVAGDGDPAVVQGQLFPGQAQGLGHGLRVLGRSPAQAGGLGHHHHAAGRVGGSLDEGPVGGRVRSGAVEEQHQGHGPGGVEVRRDVAPEEGLGRRDLDRPPAGGRSRVSQGGKEEEGEEEREADLKMSFDIGENLGAPR